MSVVATKTKPGWYWVLVLPAFGIGLVVPGFLGRLLWELFLWDAWAQVMQSLVGGFCAVWFAAYIAPRFNLAVAVIGFTFIAVMSGVTILFAFVFTTSYPPSAILIDTLIILAGAAGALYEIWRRQAGRMLPPVA